MRRTTEELIWTIIFLVFLVLGVLVLVSGCTILERDFGDAMTIEHSCIAEFETGGTIDCTSGVDRSRHDKGKDTNVEAPNISGGS